MIRKITPSGVVTTFSGMGSAHPGSNDGVGTAASFNHPNGIAIDAQGNLYIADEGNNKIRKITQAGVVTTFAGIGGSAGGEIDGPGNIATFASPEGLAVDATGNVYVADYAGNKIRKIDPNGFVSTIAGTGVAGSTDGIGSVAKFNGPMGVAIDGNGILYIADGNNYVIRKIVLH